MSKVQAVILGVMAVGWLLCFVKLFYKTQAVKKERNVTKFIVRVAIFGAISAVLYCVPLLKFPVPIFPSFLEFHFDEIPIFIAGFAYGPFSALGVILVKTLIKLPMSGTLCVGELSDLLFSTAFVLPASIIYQKHRNIKGALLGLGIGTICQVIIAVLGNIYLMVPFYMFMYNMSAEQLLKICQMANPAISNVGWAYGLMAVLPFNLIKDAVIIVVTFLVYKSTHRYIDKLQNA